MRRSTLHAKLSLEALFATKNGVRVKPWSAALKLINGSIQRICTYSPAMLAKGCVKARSIVGQNIVQRSGTYAARSVITGKFVDVVRKQGQLLRADEVLPAFVFAKEGFVLSITPSSYVPIGTQLCKPFVRAQHSCLAFPYKRSFHAHYLFTTP